MKLLSGIVDRVHLRTCRREIDRGVIRGVKRPRRDRLVEHTRLESHFGKGRYPCVRTLAILSQQARKEDGHADRSATETTVTRIRNSVI